MAVDATTSVDAGGEKEVRSVREDTVGFEAGEAGAEGLVLPRRSGRATRRSRRGREYVGGGGGGVGNGG